MLACSHWTTHWLKHTHTCTQILFLIVVLKFLGSSVGPTWKTMTRKFSTGENQRALKMPCLSHKCTHIPTQMYAHTSARCPWLCHQWRQSWFWHPTSDVEGDGVAPDRYQSEHHRTDHGQMTSPQSCDWAESCPAPVPPSHRKLKAQAKVRTDLKLNLVSQ